MPCSDGGVPYPPTREEILNSKVPPAMLCALLSVGLPPGLLDSIDWNEAGVTRAEFEEWWRLHRLQDEQRRKREMARKLPAGEYAVRDEVTWDNRHWLVTAVVVVYGKRTITMVTADDRDPVRQVRLEVHGE